MNRRALIILFSLIIAILVVVLIWGISGNWNGIRSGADMTGLSQGAEFHTDVSGISAVTLDFTSADIILERVQGSTVSISQESYGTLPDADRMRCGVQGNTVVARVPTRIAAGCMGQISHRSVVHVEIPADADLVVDAGTLSGDIEVQEMQLSDCNFNTLSGGITARGLQAGRLSLDVASGTVHMTGITCDDLDVDSLSGDVEVDADVDGEASVDAASGSIRFSGHARELDIDTASGDVEVGADVDGKVSAEAASGSITFSGRAQELNLHSASGSIDADAEGVRNIRTEAFSGETEITCRDAEDLRSVRAESASGTVRLNLPAGSVINLDFDSASGKFRTEGESGILFGDGRGIEVRVSTASGDLYIETI